jgi:putative transposase
MDEYESLSHSKWECKYHVVFIPKCRRRALYKSLRKHLGEVFRKLAEQKESRIGERKQNYAGQNFWARGYFVSTVGRDEATIRAYIRNQEKEDQRPDQMNLWK